MFIIKNGMFNFEKLKVWEKSIHLSSNIHDLIKNFPSQEKYVLSSQILRASDSISLNIAEGSTGQSPKEFNRFLSYALRSCIEVVACLYLAKDRNLISQEIFISTYQDAEEIIKMIQGLKKRNLSKL